MLRGVDGSLSHRPSRPATRTSRRFQAPKSKWQTIWTNVTAKTADKEAKIAPVTEWMALKTAVKIHFPGKE